MAIGILMAGTIVHLPKFQFCGELAADGQTNFLRGVCVLKVHGAGEKKLSFPCPRI